MVTKIVSGQSIRGLLNYNENKVAAGMAAVILASRFATDIDKLDFRAKLNRFESLTETNSRVKTNAMHLMLNFDREDKLSMATMQLIAGDYMDRIGFGEQPYLVYLHKDANHPHLHIVTTNMQADGKRIPIHNIGKTLSEAARKELEIQYRLVKADGKKKSEALAISPIDIQKAFYSKIPTKQAINNVVSAVMRSYKFTSLAEYNAILKQFNVIADRGKEDTVMFEKKGLVYSIIDENGKRIGIPFKASVLSNKPILANLEKKYKWNAERRKPFKEPLKETIDKVFQKYASISKATFAKELAKQNLNVVFRRNDRGYIYGITFIDNRNKTVFNGSDLGKQYSAKAITEKLTAADELLVPEKREYLKAPKQSSYLRPPAPLPILKGLLDKTRMDQSPGVPRRRKKKRPNTEQDQQQEQSL